MDSCPMKCFYCGLRFQDHSTRRLMRHLQAAHGIGFRGIKSIIACGSCPYTSCNAKAFSCHTTEKHGKKKGLSQDGTYQSFGTDIDTVEPILLQAQPEPGLPVDIDSRLFTDSGRVEGEHTSSVDHHDDLEKAPGPDDESSIDDFISRFILELYSKGSTTRSQIQLVIEGTTTLLDQVIGIIRKKCEAVTEGNRDIRSKISNVFKSVTNPFADYSSEHKRIRRFVEAGLVQPTEIQVSTRLDNYTGVTRTIRSTIQYIPIKETLQRLYSHKEFRNSIIVRSEREHGIATKPKQNQLFVEHPKALRIAIYNDDIECGNVLSSRSGINKMTMYYFMILNCPNYSSLSSIHLAMVAHSSDVKQCGHSAILKPLIDDIKDLEHGLYLGDDIGTVFGTVVCLPGDNLSANETQGFVGSFSANYYCRFCKMHTSMAKTSCRQDSQMLRTPEGHLQDLQEAAANPASVTNHGVKSPCVFDELKYFSVIDSFTPDLMHDLFEGICKRELSLMLTAYVCDLKYLSIDRLNGMLSSFDYGVSDRKNKPSAVFMDKGVIKIKQTASQVWCLLRTLPVIIGECIPENDEMWAIFLLLRDITELLFCPIMTESLTYVVEHLVELHHEAYLKIYQLPLTPKHHFLTHYGEAIRRNGAVSDYWCMRFESKHKMAKLVTAASGNTMNVPKTIATRYQLKSFHHWSKVQDVVDVPIQYSKRDDQIISATYKGTCYHVGMAVCCGLGDDGNAIIQVISQIQGDLTAKANTAVVAFDPHIRCYIVEDVDRTSTTSINLKGLLNSTPMDILWYKGERVISQRESFV